MVANKAATVPPNDTTSTLITLLDKVLQNHPQAAEFLREKEEILRAASPANPPQGATSSDGCSPQQVPPSQDKREPPEDIEQQVRNLLSPEQMQAMFGEKCKDGEQPWEAFNTIVAKHFVAGATKAILAF